MITTDGSKIVAKFMLGQAPAFASYIAAGVGPEPLFTGASAAIPASKKALDFEAFRVPILSRGFIKENGVEKLILKAEMPNYHELQIWCADMWALLWNAWKDGVTTVCHPSFDFSWGTSSKAEYDRLNIFHNAGVVSGESGLFHKAKYMTNYPYGLDLQIRENSASAEYYDWVRRAEKNSALL